MAPNKFASIPLGLPETREREKERETQRQTDSDIYD